jgi:hypothetical protein
MFANHHRRGERDGLDCAVQWQWHRRFRHDNNWHRSDVERYGSIQQYVWPGSRSRQNDVLAEQCDFEQ